MTHDPQPLPHLAASTRSTFEGQEYKLDCSEMEIIEFAKVDAPCEVRDVELFFNGTIAAPELLEALETLVHKCLQQAIKKAKGE